MNEYTQTSNLDTNTARLRPTCDRFSSNHIVSIQSPYSQSFFVPSIHRNMESYHIRYMFGSIGSVMHVDFKEMYPYKRHWRRAIVYFDHLNKSEWTTNPQCTSINYSYDVQKDSTRIDTYNLTLVKNRQNTPLPFPILHHNMSDMTKQVREQKEEIEKLKYLVHRFINDTSPLPRQTNDPRDRISLHKLMRFYG